jgi:hypothetical protein
VRVIHSDARFQRCSQQSRIFVECRNEYVNGSAFQYGLYWRFLDFPNLQEEQEQIEDAEALRPIEHERRGQRVWTRVIEREDRAIREIEDADDEGEKNEKLASE